MRCPATDFGATSLGFIRAMGATLEAHCRLLLPRQIAKLFKGKRMVGRGGGDRKYYRAEFQGLGRNAGER